MNLCDTFRCLSTVSNKCPGGQFTCTNLRCIPTSEVCDGNNDCMDFSDERNCSKMMIMMMMIMMTMVMLVVLIMIPTHSKFKGFCVLKCEKL